MGHGAGIVSANYESGMPCAAGEPQSVEGDEFGHVEMVPEAADTQEGIQSSWRGLIAACGTDLAYVLSDHVEEETTCTGGVDVSIQPTPKRSK